VSTTADAKAPEGIFDRSTLGRVLPPTRVTVERGRIRFFAEVLGEQDPIHTDIEVARDRGYPDLVAPASFITVIDAEVNATRGRLGASAVADVINCDLGRLLHGEERYEYCGLIFAGDELSATTTITDFYDKKGGTMEFATFVTAFEHAERGVLARATRTLLHRLV
jgi:acyl dehydratase